MTFLVFKNNPSDYYASLDVNVIQLLSWRRTFVVPADRSDYILRLLDFATHFTPLITSQYDDILPPFHKPQLKTAYFPIKVVLITHGPPTQGLG